jgi:hypothetical protein
MKMRRSGTVTAAATGFTLRHKKTSTFSLPTYVRMYAEIDRFLCLTLKLPSVSYSVTVFTVTPCVVIGRCVCTLF